LHGVTVVGVNLGSPLYLDVVAPEKLRSTAQGVLSMVASGVAGMVSNIAAGWFIDRSSIDVLYLISGSGLLVLGGFAWWILPALHRRDEELSEVVLPSDSVA
jgi:MFS family permease